MDYLKELNERTLLTVELGLQTIHERTARIINRGYDLQEFMEAYKALKIRGIRICVHLINGLPGETKRMMLESAAYLGQLRPEAVKIHMLHVLRDTPMETLYRRKKYRPLSRDEYIRLVCCQLEVLPPETVIERLTGDREKRRSDRSAVDSGPNCVFWVVSIRHWIIGEPGRAAILPAAKTASAIF